MQEPKKGQVVRLCIPTDEKGKKPETKKFEIIGIYPYIVVVAGVKKGVTQHWNRTSIQKRDFGKMLR